MCLSCGTALPGARHGEYLALVLRVLFPLNLFMLSSSVTEPGARKVLGLKLSFGQG